MPEIFYPPALFSILTENRNTYLHRTKTYITGPYEDITSMNSKPRYLLWSKYATVVTLTYLDTL